LNKDGVVGKTDGKKASLFEVLDLGPAEMYSYGHGIL